jgi:renalase
MIDFCILGSGFAGSTIANLLSKKYSVEVFDKARGPGGRLSNRRLKSNLSFDHGAQYFSPQTKEFKNFILKLYKKKIVKLWSGNHLDFAFKAKDNNLKYIGVKANNHICKYQLKKIKQNYFAHISKIIYKKKIWEITFKDKKKILSKALIITCPYPQLKKLAKKYLDKKMINLDISMEPNITVMLAIKGRNLPVSSINFNNDTLAWAANENSKKRFTSNINLWTLQSSIKWSKKNINTYKKNSVALNCLVSSFLKLTGFKKKQIIYKKIHGWKYSYNLNKSPFKSHWNTKYKLGICGDWFIGPKAENAWVSAVNLYNAQKKSPL